MRIEITGRHVEVTDAIKDYARSKVEKHLAEFLSVESVHVILDVQKFRRLAEVVVQGRSHLRLDASDESEDMYASIDLAIDKIARQLRKSRDKVVTHYQTGSKLGEIEAERAGKD